MKGKEGNPPKKSERQAPGLDVPQRPAKAVACVTGEQPCCQVPGGPSGQQAGVSGVRKGLLGFKKLL